MFRRRSAAARIEEQHAAHIADLKEAWASERTALMKVVEALADQIDYLRVTLGRPYVAKQPTPGLAWQGIEDLDLLSPSDVTRLHFGEEEEDLLALRESGLISEHEHEAALARLQIQ